MPLVPADIVDELSRAMFSGRAKAKLDNDEAAQITDAAARALITIEEFADNIQMTGSSENAPTVWKPWYFWLAVQEVAPFLHPDQDYSRNLGRARLAALSSYQNEAIDYNLSSDSEYATVNYQTVRYFVMEHYARLEGFPAFPAIKSIDAATLHVYNGLWNRAGWNVRRRLVRMKIDYFTFENATWAASTRTITKTSGMGAAAAGSMVLITDGTNAVKREFTVISSTSDALVVSSDIGADDAASDIDGKVMTISFENLPSGESYDSTASVKWNYTDATGSLMQLRWASADVFSEAKSVDNETSTGRPELYRTSEIGTTDSWITTPFPDKDYFLDGEIFIARPANPTSATDALPFSALFAESLPWVKRAVLSEVLTNHGRRDAALQSEVVSEMDTMFPAYQDLGAPDSDLGTKDVYRDTAYLRGGMEGHIGGAL